MKGSFMNISSDKKSYLFLCAAGVMIVFACGRWAAPVANWIALTFMLRFLRMQKPVRGLFLGLAVYFAAISIAFYGVMLVPNIVLFLVTIGIISIISFIPFAVDRLLAARLEGFLSTLLFPLAVTTIEYAASFSPASGGFGSLANTQWPDLPLVQISSITGIWGISFLMSWFSSVLAWAWSHDFSWDRIRKGVCIYAVVLVAVLMFGGLRLAFYQNVSKPVMVAGVTTQRPIKPHFMEWLRTSKCPPVEESIAELKEKTDRAALTGARIIVWNEYTALISSQDEPRYVQRGQDLARKHGIYLLLSVAVMGNSKKVDSDNIAVLIDPRGKVVWRYSKSHLAYGVESFFMVPGKKDIPVVDTPYGKIAAVICFDMDFPSYIRLAAKKGADIMLVPSNDWREIAPWHTYMAGFRAVENGFTVLRVTGNGYTAAFDAVGRVLAGMDYFTTGSYLMSAEIPTRRVATVYSIAGDWFAWFCIVSLVAVSVFAVRKGKQCGLQQ
ncbi:MAG: apolipoprotein N-acyltransferase [Spirochaetes bacterium]|nr:apolipoprotein N-acyltransferase [Spirochaetota bacterium]